MAPSVVEIELFRSIVDTGLETVRTETGEEGANAVSDNLNSWTNPEQETQLKAGKRMDKCSLTENTKIKSLRMYTL